MFSKSFYAALGLAAAVSAVPTPTHPSEPSPVVKLTGVTHTVVAGLGGLRFEPDNVVAEKGDVVEWHFLPRNHAVAQSSFGEPCQPLADGPSIYSGFNFAVEEGQADDVFQIVVEQTKTPIWYYCPQQNGDHCKNGMTGVINQNFDDQAFSLRAHRELAAKVEKSVIPAVEGGGVVIPNPNPLSGFKLRH
ncbi:hypothetical protein ACHAQH_001246 [Verticillium albo-atrum]